ncbi:putative Allatostatins MIP [Sergentomyia squamirostris]
MNRGVSLTLVLIWGVWMVTTTSSMEIPDEDPTETKRSWNNLQASWGKRWSDDLEDADEARLENLAAGHELNQKRTWKAMNGAWGKRVMGGGPGSDWNKFRSAWGKREPGWNNLKGLWGKRSNGNNWNRLSSAWGKRSDLDLDMDM